VTFFSRAEKPEQWWKLSSGSTALPGLPSRRLHVFIIQGFAERAKELMVELKVDIAHMRAASWRLSSTVTQVSRPLWCLFFTLRASVIDELSKTPPDNFAYWIHGAHGTGVYRNLF
jgi:hypothetical protein